MNPGMHDPGPNLMTARRMKQWIAGLPLKWPMLMAAMIIVCWGGAALAQGKAPTMPIPKINVGVTPAESPQDVALSLQIIFLMTILTLAPSLLMMMTSFTRIIIVFSLARNALGTQQMPPNQILAGIALFLTFFIMAPVFKDANENALQPYLKKELTHEQAMKRAEIPFREFMFKQTRKKDLALFINLSRIERPNTKKDVPTYVLIPAFIISELTSAFIMGFLIYIPFLVIDMVVASTLMSMGMLMLPPIMISLPFKLLVFVLIDGWALITRGLILSFNY